MTITRSNDELEGFTSKTNISRRELKAIASLAGIFSLRMLGLFMILPIFALSAKELQGANPQNIGIAIGIYGLMQAIFQAPLGYISDRLGRKEVITLGLILLSLGSIVAAMSHSIFGVILGRCLQGMGAVGGVTMALLSDLTREELRIKAMAIVGISIGASFALAFVIGPLLAAVWGLSGIFWVIALLSLIAIFFIPKNQNDDIVKDTLQSRKSTTVQYGTLNKPVLLHFFNPQILFIFFGIFVLHACLTAIFLEIPIALHVFIPKHDLPLHFYLPIFLASVLTTFPILSLLEKLNRVNKLKNKLIIFIIPIFILICSLFCMSLSLNSLNFFYFLAFSLYLFFTAFNILEASLPAYLSKLAPANIKGLMLGIFSSLQFLGLFLGGFLGGWLNVHFGFLAVFVFCVILTMIWLIWNIFTLNFKHS